MKDGGVLSKRGAPKGSLKKRGLERFPFKGAFIFLGHGVS